MTVPSPATPVTGVAYTNVTIPARLGLDRCDVCRALIEPVEDERVLHARFHEGGGVIREVRR